MTDAPDYEKLNAELDAKIDATVADVSDGIERLKADNAALLRLANFAIATTGSLDRFRDEDMTKWAARLHQKLRDIRSVSESAIRAQAAS